MGCDIKTFCHTLEFLSQHKVLCRDRNVPPLGKLCHDIRRPLLRPKLGLAPNTVTTLNFCRDTGLKNLCCDREDLCRDPNRPTCLGIVSRHGDPCRDTKPESFVTRASQLHAHACRMRPGWVMRLTLEPCRDTEDPVATQG